MPIPQETEIRKVILEAVKGNNPHNLSTDDLLRIAAEYSGEDINALSSNDKTIFKTTITRAKEYLKRHKLISNPSSNTYIITKMGAEILDRTTHTIDDELLQGLSAKPSQPAPNPKPENISVPPLPETSEPQDENNDALEEQDIQDLPDNIDMSDSQEEPQEDADIQPEDTQVEPEEILPEPEDTQESETDTLPEPEDTEESETEDIPEDIDTPEEATEGEDIMPAEDLAPEDEALAENYPDGAVIQSQSIEDVIARHDSELADRVLMRVASMSPETFEVFVIDLLSKMGYRAFQNARYTNDEADNGMIQGVILDTQTPTPIYIHAQKLSPGHTVGRADVQDFVEALADKGGKGIFATAAEFSENAITYAQDERIMIIDGKKLAGLMIAHNFCVNVEKVIEVKEIDEDSFSDYES